MKNPRTNSAGIASKVLLIATFFLVLFAIFISLGRHVTPKLAQYRGQIESLLTNIVHQPVVITKISAKWRGTRPIISFQDVTIYSQDHKKPLIQVHEFTLEIDTFKSLLNHRLQFGLLSINGLDLSLKQDENNNIVLVGMAENGKESPGFKEFLLPWLLAQNQLQLHDVSLNFFQKNGELVHLTDIEMGLRNNENKHYFWGQSEVDKTTNAKIRFVVDFTGDWQTPENWSGNYYCKLINVQLSDWMANYHWQNVSVKQGLLYAEMWGSWNAGKITEVIAEIKLDDLESQLKNNNIIKVNYLTGLLRWQPAATDQWILQGDDVEIKLNNQIWPAGHFVLNYTPSQQFLLTSDVELAPLAKVILQSSLLKTDQTQLIKTLQPSGHLRDLFVAHQGDLQDFAKEKWQAIGTLDDISWQSWQAYPGFKHFSARFRYTLPQTDLFVTTKNAQLIWPKQFRETINFQDLFAELSWQKNAEQWNVNGKNIYIKNADISAYGNFSLKQTNTQTSPYLNLAMGFHVNDAGHESLYLPYKILKPALLKWLDEGILGGIAVKSTLLIRGTLADYPYDNATGVFVSDSQLNNVTLNYQNDWPPITQLDARLIFAGRSLDVIANTGKIYEAKIQHVEAKIPALSGPVPSVLYVNGQIYGDLSDGMRVLKESPLKATLGKRLKLLEWQGPMSLNLGITVPLDDDNAPTQVKGDLKFSQSTLSIPDWKLVVKNLGGGLSFDSDALFANQMQGQFFNRPILITIDTQNPGKKDSVIQVNLASQVAINDLASITGQDLTKYVTGQTSFQGVLTFAAGNQQTDTWLFTSDLNGIAIDLPAPLNKPANTILPLKVTLNTTSTDENAGLKLVLADRLSAAIKLNLANKAEGLISAVLKIGAVDAGFADSPGLVLEGAVTELPWQEWKQKFWSNDGKSTSTSAFMKSPLAQNVRVRLTNYKLLGNIIDQLDVKVARLTTGWQLSLNSTPIQGSVTIPDVKNRPWIADFQRCYLKSSDDHQKNSLKPNDIPTINFTCNDLRYNDKKFGRAEISMVTSGQDLSFNRIVLSSNNYRLLGQGDWLGNGGQSMNIEGEITSNNLAQLLRDWGLPAMIEANSSEVKFSLGWSGGPDNFSLKNLQGDVSLNFQHGNVVDIGSSANMKMNFGKLLNIMNFESLQRRIKLDFSDLTQSGFPFDTMRGNFKLSQGNAVTPQTYLVGPVAEVNISGRIGLAAEDYDVQVKITPHYTSTIPIVATVAGGPVAGVVAWVADKALSKQVEGMTSYTYKVTGSWAAPNVSSMDNWSQKFGFLRKTVTLNNALYSGE